MARLPDTFSPRPTPNLAQPAQSVGNTGAIAGALGRVAGGIAALGAVSDRIATEIEEESEIARALDVETDFARWASAHLSDPDAGFLASQKRVALDGYSAAIEALDKKKAETLEGLPDGVRRRVRAQIESRYISTRTAIDNHTFRERKAYVDDAMESRVALAADDAVAAYDSDGDVKSALAAGAFVIDRMARQNGWSPEEAEVRKTEFRSKALRAVVARRGEDDPAAALAYAKANSDDLTGQDMAAIEASLMPEAKRRAGAAWASGVVSGRRNDNFITSENHSPDISRVKPAVLDRFAQLQGVLNRQIPINSGFRDPERNERADGVKKSQHMHGNALDLDVSDMSREERLEVIRAASALGFTGIGVYNNAIHLDIGPRRAWGPDTTRKTIPDWARSTISQHFAGEISLPSVSRSDAMVSAVEIDDPDVRAGAIQELRLRAAAENAAAAEREKAARNELWRLVEAGQSPHDAEPETVLMAGQATVEALERRHAIKTAGHAILTDPEVYRDLTMMAAEDPEAFRAADLMAVSDSLSAGDYQRFVTMQAQIAEGSTPKPGAFGGPLQNARRYWESHQIFNGQSGTPEARRWAQMEVEFVRRAEDQALTPSRAFDLAAEVMMDTPPAEDSAEPFDITIASLRSVAQSLMASNGLTARTEDAAARRSAFENALLEAAERYHGATGVKPTQPQIRRMAESLLVPMRLDSRGFFTSDKVFAYELTLDDFRRAARGDDTIFYNGEPLIITDPELAYRMIVLNEAE